MAIAHGRAAEAITYHALGPLLFALCVVQIPYRLGIIFYPRLSILRLIHAAGDTPVRLVVVALVILWFFRLSTHLVSYYAS